MNCISIYKIASLLKEKNWIIHNFYDIESEKVCDTNIIYDVDSFLKSHKQYGYDYILILDRNVFDYIIKSTEKFNEFHKTAIALILYCQYFNITIEPNLAIYEKLNRDKLNIDELNTEYRIFRSIDNSSNVLVDFINNEELILIENTNYVLLPQNMIRQKKLNYWNIFEIGIYKLSSIYFDSKIKRKDKFNEFISYIKEKFIFSIVLIIYAIFLFDKKSMKGIMKLNLNDSKKEKEKSIYNMIWDIYNVFTYYNKMTNKETKVEYLFVSADNLLLDILRCCIDIQYDNVDYVKNIVQDKANLVLLDEILEIRRYEIINNIKKDKIAKDFIKNEINYLRKTLKI